MTYLDATEVKIHAFIRNLFYWLTLINAWFTSPITTFRIVVLKSEWIPLKNMKGYSFKEDGDIIRVRHKSTPGEYRFVSTRTDFGTILAEVKFYFER